MKKFNNCLLLKLSVNMNPKIEICCSNNFDINYNNLFQSFFGWSFDDRRFLVEDFEHLGLHLFFLHDESVLIPNEVRRLWIDIIVFHTVLKEVNNILIVGGLCKTKAFAVVHKLFEFSWLVFAEFFNSHFFLLLFNIGVFLLLCSSW